MLKPLTVKGKPLQSEVDMSATQERDERRVESQTVVTQQVAAQSTEDSAVASVTDSLTNAIKSLTGEIEECDSTIEKAEARKQELQTQLKDTMLNIEKAVKRVQAQYSGVLSQDRPRASQPPQQGRGGTNRHGQKSVRALILDFLDRKGEAKTSEIKQMLRDQGRESNPGVELSRMVKDRSVINRERGVYVLPRNRN